MEVVVWTDPVIARLSGEELKAISGEVHLQRAATAFKAEIEHSGFDMTKRGFDLKILFSR